MKLYEVNQTIEDLLASLEPDPETGEAAASEDVMMQLYALEQERDRILEYLAKLILNCRTEAAAIKAEEKRLSERRRSLESRNERLMEILDRECAGRKTDCGVATVCYRKVSRVEVSDSENAVSWLTENGYRDCYRIPKPEICKTEVKKLMQNGTEVPGIEIVQELSCSLK